MVAKEFGRFLWPPKYRAGPVASRMFWSQWLSQGQAHMVSWKQQFCYPLFGWNLRTARTGGLGDKAPSLCASTELLSPEQATSADAATAGEWAWLVKELASSGNFLPISLCPNETLTLSSSALETQSLQWVSAFGESRHQTNRKRDYVVYDFICTKKNLTKLEKLNHIGSIHLMICLYHKEHRYTVLRVSWSL